MPSYTECDGGVMNFYDFNGMGSGNCDNNGDFKDKFDTYASKSESELMDELTKVAQRMRADGTFDVNLRQLLHS